MTLTMENKQHFDSNDLKNKDFLFDVVKRCQDGDTEAMEIVYTRYKSPLFNLAYRFAGDSSLAEDLLQEIFIKIFGHIKKLRSPEALNSWLYRIATNTCISFVRKKEKTKEVPLDEFADISNTQYDDRHVRKDLEAAIKTLPPKQKIVFQLHDIQGFTHTEIAQIMSSSVGTAKSQLFKARMKIRNYLGRDAL